MDIFNRDNLRFCKRSGEKHYSIMLYCDKNKRFIMIGNVDGTYLLRFTGIQQAKYEAENEETGKTGGGTLYTMHKNIEGITDEMKDYFLTGLNSTFKASTVNKLKKKRFVVKNQVALVEDTDE
jgi:hypothetical protein